MACKNLGIILFSYSTSLLQHPLIGSKNITPVLLGPVLKNRLLKHYWYQFKLPRVLDRYRADVYVNQDKMACLRTGTAQMMIVEDLAFMDKSGGYNAGERRYLKKYFRLFLQKRIRSA